MKTKKTKRRRFFGMTIGELCAMAGLIAGGVGAAISVAGYFDEKFASIDRRFEAMDRKFETRFDSVDVRLDKMDQRLDEVEERLDGIEVDLKKTSNLINNYLTWRFLYLHDPTRKNIEPRYDPNERTLEFFDKGAKSK